MEELKYGIAYKKWLDKVDKVKDQLKQVYAIYYNQCDDDMKSTLAENPSFETVNKTKDLIGLYKILQSVNFSHTNSEEPIMSMWKAKADFVKLRQSKGQSVSKYYERFIALRDVNETLNTNIYDDLGFADVIAREQGKDLTAMTEDQKDAFKIENRCHVGRIRTHDGRSFPDGIRPRTLRRTHIKNLHHNYLMNKRNEYPKNLQAAYTLLKGWSTSKSPHTHTSYIGCGIQYQW
jgi:hypothetical protein